MSEEKASSASRSRLDERSLATLVAHVGDFEESLPRTLCWTAAWDMTRDAEMPARDYVATVLAGIAGESDIGVVQALLRQVQAALTQFADPGWAPTGRAQLAEAAVQAVHAAEPDRAVANHCVDVGGRGEFPVGP